jgi:pimeloyl-ACP methyl ester carboxylesterase
MPEFQTGNGSIHYEILSPAIRTAGDYPWITLLHNFMSTGRAAWGQLLDYLADNFRILLPDMPGHGRSIGYPARFSHLAMAGQIADLMQSVGAQRGHLAGCSSGGMVAQLLVDQRLVQPQTLTLISTTYSLEIAGAMAGTRLYAEGFQASARWLEATARLHDPFHYDGYYTDEILPAFEKLGGDTGIELEPEALADWALPVLIVHGRDDEFFPAEIARRMAMTLPEAVLELIPDQSHALIFRQPWRVGELMQDFLIKHVQ